MWFRWLATVFSLMDSCAAMARLVLPCATSAKTSVSRVVRPSALSCRCDTVRPSASSSPDVEQLGAAGLRFRNDTVSGPGGQQILLEDPAGNPIELFYPTGA